MYFNDSGEQFTECDSEREYFVAAEIYISNAAGATLRKYKKQGDEARPRDKPSWLGLGKGLPTESGHWRPAICKLTKESNVERCLLNIYVDESILFQTVYIHLLRQTDIRPADNSLFFRKDCVVIQSTEKQKWVACDNAEPVYLQISKPGLRNLWISLLRLYAIPEIYGRWLNRLNTGGVEKEGGYYRIWREVQLTVAQGRNLGTTSLEDIDNEAEFKDIDVYCEVRLNDTTYARTTTKKGLGHPEWHESFIFSDLPPFESLEIVIFKEKKVLRPSILGKVFIDLVTFRRAELLEGWYPVHCTNFSSQLQSGDLRLKIRVNEEIILPHHSYEGLQQACRSAKYTSHKSNSFMVQALNKRNYLLWMQDLENTLHIRTLSQHLINLAIVQETIVQQVQEAAEWEVERASHQTIFRGNTIFTKTMEKCIAWYGSSFLEASIGAVLRRLLSEKIAIEVDPIRSGKNAKDVGRHVELLIHWCKEFWEQIYAVREDCPNELRSLLDKIRILVEEHGRKSGILAKMQEQRPWQSVSAFIFLRFIVPGILHPHLFGLCSGLPDPAIQRSLKLVAKVIQSMANLNTADQREISMSGIRDFIKDNMPRMMDYLATVSTPKPSMYSSFRFEDRNDRYSLNNLIQKKVTLSTLERESVPASPHYIDPSREMAIITSNIIRHSRDPSSKIRPRVLGDRNLEHLCSTCFDVEGEALHRVNELATRLSQERKRAFASTAWGRKNSSSTQEPLASAPALDSGRKVSIHSTRPASTALPQVVLQPVVEILSGRANPSTNPTVVGYSQSEKADAIATNIGGSSLQKSLDPPTSESLDDGAKRKRSFIRGIFGGEPKNSGRPR